MYFALAGMMEMFRYLHYGLSLVLVFVGAKMLLSHYLEIPTPVALAAVAGVLAISVIASVANPKRSANVGASAPCRRERPARAAVARYPPASIRLSYDENA